MPAGAFKHEYTIIEKYQDKYGNLSPRIATKLVIDQDYDHPLKIVNPKETFTYE